MSVLIGYTLKMTDHVPELWKGMSLFCGLVGAPTAVLSSDNISHVERYGIAGVLGIVAVVTFHLWRRAADSHEEHMKSQIDSLKREIQRLRENSDK